MRKNPGSTVFNLVGTKESLQTLRHAFWLTALVALLAACGMSPSTEDDVVVEFRSASTQSMTNEGDLDGAVVTDVVALEVRDSPRFMNVSFHVDDPELAGEPTVVAIERPFAMELDTTVLPDGAHSVTVTVTVSDGRAPVATKEFIVANETDGVLPEEPTDAGVDEGAGEDVGTDVAEDVGAEPGETGPALPAATLFVAPGGSGDGRSAGAPTSVQRAADTVGPGDVVHLEGGTYPIDVRFTNSGTSSEPIVWTSAPGAWAVFDGSGHTPITSSAKFNVAGASHNVFMNLEVANGPQEGIYVNGSHDNVFRNIITHGHQYSGIGNINSDRNLYEDITTYDNFDDRNPRGLYGDDADGIALSSGDSNVVRHVVAYENSDDGIDAWKSTNTVIEYVVSYRNGRGSHGNGNGIKAGGGNGHQNDTIVRHSIAFDNKSNGFDDNSGRGITFENNTAFGNGGYSFMGGSTTSRRNNIAVGGSVGQWGAMDSNNSWDLGIGDPQFVSTDPGSAEFLTLEPGSPAIGVGTGGADLGAITASSTFADLIGTDLLGTVVGLRADGDTLALR